MTEIERTELEWLTLANARADAVVALVARDPVRAREVAERARAVADRFFARSDMLAARAHAAYGSGDFHQVVGDYLRVAKTALSLSSAARALERELEYRYPRRPVYL